MWKCIDYDTDTKGDPKTVYCRYLPNSKSGSKNASSKNVRGNIHWLSSRHAASCKVNLFDRLFISANPLASDNFLEELNPNSKCLLEALVEPSLKKVTEGDQFQFERHGYFVTDSIDRTNQIPTFNQTVTLRDSWGKSKR